MSASLPPRSSDSDELDVFISYKSGCSSKQAQEVADCLTKLNRRHPQGPGIRIFLDTTSLAPGTLSERILVGLRKARYLVVLLAPETRDSYWVNREISDWLTIHDDPSRIFLIQADPKIDLTWNESGFSNPQGLPQALEGVFDSEQKYCIAPSSARDFPEAEFVAMYGTIVGLKDSALRYREEQLRRSAMRKTRIVVTALTVLLCSALLAGGLAVANWLAAERSTRIAEGESEASQALLTLDSSAAEAIDLAVSASNKSDSASVRSLLLAVAAETSQLNRTISFPTEETGEQLSSISFSRDGSRLTAWGLSGSDTRLVTYSTIDARPRQDHVIADRQLTSVGEIDGLGYLACTETDVIFIRHGSSDYESLYDLPDLKPHTGRHCRVFLFQGGAVAEVLASSQLADENLSAIVAINLRGERRVFEDSRVRTPWDREPDDYFITSYIPQAQEPILDDQAMLIIGSDGATGMLGDEYVEVPELSNAIVVDYSTSGNYLVRNGDGDYLTVKGADGTFEVNASAVPRGTSPYMVAGGSGYSMDGDAVIDYQIWTDAAGTVQWTNREGNVFYDDLNTSASGRTAEKAYLPTLTRFDSGHLLTVGGTVWKLSSLTATAMVTSRALPGSLGTGKYSQQLVAKTTSAAAGVIYTSGGGDAFYVVPSYDNASLTRTSGSPYFAGGLIVDTDDGIELNGVKLSGFRREPGQQIQVSDQAAAPQLDGTILLLNYRATELAPWRIGTVGAGPVSAMGAARYEQQRLVRKAEGYQESVWVPSKHLSATWHAWKPDGTAGILQHSSGARANYHVGLGNPDSISPLEGDCLNEERLAYFPGPDFERSIDAAEAQHLHPASATVFTSGNGIKPTGDECFTGEFADWSDDTLLLDYDVGSLYGRITWARDSELRVTSWRRGDRNSLATSVLPMPAFANKNSGGEPVGAPAVVFSSDSRHVVLAPFGTNTATEYIWSGSEWVEGRSFAAAVGAVSQLSMDSAAALLVTFAADGQFEIWDMQSGRSLARSNSAIGVTVSLASAKTSETDDALFIHLSARTTSAQMRDYLVEIPTSVAALREILCQMHPTQGCAAR